MTQRISLEQINDMPRQAFIDCLGSIFEHSSWVAEEVHSQVPFESLDALHSALVTSVRNAGRSRQLNLLRAHPELAGKAARAGALTRESTAEQASAGLGQCTPDELEELRSLNKAYSEKFAFPFIMAVRGRNKGEILAAMRLRLARSPAEEFDASIAQVARIGRLRLDALLGSKST